MKRIIATVGPSLLNDIPLTEVHNPRNIYRINGAHGSIDDIENYICEIRTQVPDSEILMDLPGNKVRTANVDKAIAINSGEFFELGFHQTNYPDFYSLLNKDNVVWANDSTFEFTVDSIDIKQKVIRFLSKSTGYLENNKGLHVRGIHNDMPFLFQKDEGLIELANKHKLNYVGLSFVRNEHDILQAKDFINHGIKIISKVETKAAVVNLIAILKEVDFILVDRGDLSTEVGIEKIPAYQAHILNKALYFNKKVFLATQFLKNMETNPIPTIPEVIDLYNTLQMGIYGIQMSEETAVGKYPKECLEMIAKLMDEIELKEI